MFVYLLIKLIEYLCLFRNNYNKNIGILSSKNYSQLWLTILSLQMQSNRHLVIFAIFFGSDS